MHVYLFSNPFKLILWLLLTRFTARSELLLWSSKELNLPALKFYDNNDFRRILEELEHPKVVVFKSKNFTEIPAALLDELKLDSAYIPNAEINFHCFKEVIERDRSIDEIKDMLEIYRNILVIFEKNKKRNALELPTGMLFREKGAMMYTWRPPVLRKEDSFLLLDSIACISTTANNNSVVMSLEFIVKDNLTVALTFQFTFARRVWFLETTKITDAAGDILLKPSVDIEMPKHYSYHCSLLITFDDIENDIELIFYGMQVQPYAEYPKFSKSVDCGGYMTAPILSILFVLSILLIALFIGINALISIKPLVRFENSKSRQLKVYPSDQDL